MYISVIGYYEHKDGDVVHDSGLWMVYECDDVEKVAKDFTAVAEDLKSNYGDPDDITFKIEVIDPPKDHPPKMWKDRVIQKLD